MNYEPKKLRNSYRNWIISRLDRQKTYAFVTLSLKKGIERDDGTWESLTEESATNNVAWFLKHIDRAVLGKASRKYGKYLQNIDVAEGDGVNKRRHRHLIIEVPTSHITEDKFRLRVSEIWKKSRWGSRNRVTKYEREVDVQIASDLDAVVRYLTKTGSDALSLSTTRL